MKDRDEADIDSGVNLGWEVDLDNCILCKGKIGVAIVDSCSCFEVVVDIDVEMQVVTVEKEEEEEVVV